MGPLECVVVGMDETEGEGEKGWGEVRWGQIKYMNKINKYGTNVDTMVVLQI